MPAAIKELQKNWLVLTLVIIQAVFVLGFKTSDFKKAEERITVLETQQDKIHEAVIEIRTDVKWLVERPHEQ
jgi:hypothetical protein